MIPPNRSWSHNRTYYLRKILTKNAFNHSMMRCWSPSSSGLGLRPFTAATGVRLPLGTPSFTVLSCHTFQSLAVISKSFCSRARKSDWEILLAQSILLKLGGVAQLVERNAGSVEVRGSTPLVSTNFLCNPLQIEGLQNLRYRSLQN